MTAEENAAESGGRRPTEPETIQAPTVLEVRDLYVSYGPVRAVDGVTLEIREGEIFGLLGPNGAGKTTTLSAIEGLLRPDAGSVLIEGIDMQKDPLVAKAQMGVQLQFTGFHPDLTVREIVQLYAGLYGVEMSPSRALDVLEGLGLEQEGSRRVNQLSGGQKQRLSLLIATIHEPVIVLLDEPTGGLDPQARRQLWERIDQMRKAGRSILLTTHSMEEAQAVCNRVAIMDHGKILTTDTPAGLIKEHRNDPQVRAVAHGRVTLDDVFIGLTGADIRE
ncbi:MAG: ABC transporter ATP-binding protein [Actinobacteria bacterium]|nr:ABC transporter ATP-binding protein [Actinomycetota bacterium]